MDLWKTELGMGQAPCRVVDSEKSGLRDARRKLVRGRCGFPDKLWPRGQHISSKIRIRRLQGLAPEEFSQDNKANLMPEAGDTGTARD